MLHDIRKLLLHVYSSVTHSRNNIALRAINPGFSLKSDPGVTYTLPLDKFQQTLVQQTAARKATREATGSRRHRRFQGNNSGTSGSFSNFPDQQFFRSGPPTEQGGFKGFGTNNNNNFRQNTYTRNNNNNNFQPNSSNTSNNKKSNNPFRQ